MSNTEKIRLLAQKWAEISYDRQYLIEGREYEEKGSYFAARRAYLRVLSAARYKDQTAHPDFQEANRLHRELDLP